MLSRFLEGKTILDIVGGISGNRPFRTLCRYCGAAYRITLFRFIRGYGFCHITRERYGKRRVGISSVSMQKKEQLDTFLTDGLVSVICEKARDILTLIDVRALVKNKIDSLDIMAVEGSFSMC